MKRSGPGAYNALYYGRAARSDYLTIKAVLLQALISVITGALVGFLAGALAAMLGAPEPLHYGAVGAGIAGILAWLKMLGFYLSTLREIDITLKTIADGKDLYANIKLETPSPDGRVLTFNRLPCSPLQAREIAERIAGGATVSQGNMLDIFGGSRPEFQRFQSELVAQKLAYWRSPGVPTRGIALNKAGAAKFRDLLRVPDIAPSPSDNLREP